MAIRSYADMLDSIQGLPEGTRVRAEAERALTRAIGIRTEPVPHASPPTLSRFGGMPFTPAGFDWPRNASGEPQRFIGQINFAEVLEQVPMFRNELPPRGEFQFFHDAPCVTGGDPDTCFRLVWHPDAKDSDHEVVPLPKGAYEYEESACIRFVECGSLPDLAGLLSGSWLVEYVFRDYEHRLRPAEQEAQWSYDAIAHAREPEHKVLGHAYGIQYDPRWSTAFDHQRHPWDLLDRWIKWFTPRMEALPFDDEGMVDEDAVLRGWTDWLAQDPGACAMYAELSGWRLLWQIDTDDELALMWGDLGMISVMVRADDLARGDLSRAWADWQAH